MASKKKTNLKFRADKAVKAAAREKIGSPPPTRAVPDKTKSARDKHKRSLSEMLQQE